MDLDSKDVLIGQFPSNSVKVFRKIGWVSILSKSNKVLWQSFSCRFTRSKNFVKENFDHVFDGKLIIYYYYFVAIHRTTEEKSGGRIY